MTKKVTALGKEEIHVSLDPYFTDWVDGVKEPRLKRTLLGYRTKNDKLRGQEREAKDKAEGKEREKEKEDKLKGEGSGEESDEEEGEATKEGSGVVGDNIGNETAQPPAKIDNDDAVVGKKRLHERRHEFIVEWLGKLYPSRQAPIRVLDYGCGRGHLTLAMAKVMTEARFLAIDANPWVGKNRAMKAIKRITYMCGNLLFPPNPSQFSQVNFILFIFGFLNDDYVFTVGCVGLLRGDRTFRGSTARAADEHHPLSPAAEAHHTHHS